MFMLGVAPRKDAMSTIVSVDTRDIRFPTSLELDGSDAMNPDPDYSAAVRHDPHRRRPTASPATRSCSPSGAATTCRSRRSTRSAATLLGRDVEELLGDMGEASRLLMHDSQLRWLGPRRASCTWRSARS
jgi:L-fuconate dehydratase